MIRGSIVELVAPAEANGAIKYESLEALVDWHVVEGSAALLVGDVLGAELQLDAEERLELLRRVVWQADGRIAVIAGISAERIETTLEYASVADEAGVDAVLLTLPTTIWPAKEDLLRHLEAIASAVKQPLIVRNGAERLPPAVIEAMARIEGVSGFVESATDIARARVVRTLDLPPGFALYAGSDAIAAPFILEGFTGAVSTAANLVPRMIRRLCETALAGNREQIETLQTSLRPVLQAQPDRNLPRAVQWALTEMGRVAESTPPLMLAQPSDYATLRRALRTAGCAI